MFTSGVFSYGVAQFRRSRRISSTSII